MAVSIDVKVDSKELKASLKRDGEKWAKQMERATQDMKRVAPSIIAKQTTNVYAIKQGEVHANSEKFAGSCSLSGGIADLKLEYKGRMLTPTHFKMSPAASPGFSRKYTVKATILKGSRVKIGHWQRPWSEGGKHGAESPAMLLPGKVPPIIRKGNTYKALKVISVPQMVKSERHIDDTMDKLQERQAKILDQRLASLGLT